MFYLLLYPLAQYHILFNIFRYITFRAAYATVTALLLSFLLGPGIIRWLRGLRVADTVRPDLPASHERKRGTPTMGGILILISVVIPTLLWADLRDRYVHLAVLTTLWMGGIGLLDDYLKVVRKKSKGLVGTYKLIGQVTMGIFLGVVLTLNPLGEGLGGRTTVPFFKNLLVDLSWFYVPFVVLVIVGATNAVNLADGLDGLAVGLSAFAAFAFAGFSYLQGHAKFADYLQILHLPGAGELAIFCMSIVGASLGFLWYNAHPAQVFMGDTGSMALGGAFAALAVLLRAEFLLVIVGGVFVAEALSVILQVAAFQWTGRRIFRMAPLHHHFEMGGWEESKVVTRFYILGALCALLALSTLKIR